MPKRKREDSPEPIMNAFGEPIREEALINRRERLGPIVSVLEQNNTMRNTYAEHGFFALPREIRERVYGHLLRPDLYDKPLHLSTFAAHRPGLASRPQRVRAAELRNISALGKVSRQVRKETRQFFYVHLPLHVNVMNIPNLTAFIGSGRRQMRRLTFEGFQYHDVQQWRGLLNMVDRKFYKIKELTIEVNVDFLFRGHVRIDTPNQIRRWHDRIYATEAALIHYAQEMNSFRSVNLVIKFYTRRSGLRRKHRITKTTEELVGQQFFA